MQTASFFTYRGPGRVSIARYAPRGTPAGFKMHKILAPSQLMLKMSLQPYRVAYGNILSQLDPQKIFDELHEKATDKDGNQHDPILLCWEKPPFDDVNFCHRRMVANWFKDKLGVEVPEYDPKAVMNSGQPTLNL